MIDKELMIKKLKDQIKDNEEIAIALELALEKQQIKKDQMKILLRIQSTYWFVMKLKFMFIKI